MRSGLLYLFCITTFLFLSDSATAQVYTRRIASGNGNDFNKAGASGVSGPLARRTFQAAETQALLQEDAQRTKLGLPERLGIDISVQVDFMEIATKTVEGNQQVSRFRFDVPTAQGLSIMFDTLALANGAQLFVYNADQTVLIGPVTEQQNGRNFWTDLITGESLIAELKEPLAVAGQSRIEVAKLIQFYRFVPKFGFNTSTSCEINTACYSGYQNEADGVAMLLMNYSPYTYACTGSMLNTTQQSFRSFLLTAFHCFDFSGDGSIQTAERGAAATTQVRFHWESPTCTPTSADNVYLTLTGTTLQAAYVNSDFTLLELNQQVPPSENTTYLGWDRNNSNFSSVFGIHHPSADVKKISFSNSATTFVGTAMTTGGNYYTLPGSTHLNVTWNASPNLGVTEGGSSGSALFNADRRVVGQLHGGGSYCTSPTSPDQYGRLYTSWTGGGNSSTRLSDWLNPIGSGATTTNSAKSQITGPSSFTSSATFALNTGSSSITSWVVTGGNGVISPTSGTGNTASLTATGAVSGAVITFNVNAGQTYPISFTKSFTTATGNTENFPPFGVNIPAQTATVGAPFSYTTPAFTDPEGQPLTYTAANLPAGLSFNPATRVINGTPTTSGTYVTSITAKDQGGLETSVAFLFTVNCPTVSINTSSAIICQGQSVVLTGNGATAYLWSTGQTQASIQVTPNQTITYAVTGVTGSCSVTATRMITVQSLPSLSINATATSICQGQSVSLTASGATSYVWSTGQVQASIQSAPAQTTTFSVTGTANGCSATATRTISVQLLPAITISANSGLICQGQAVSMTASGATSYLWSTGQTQASIQPTPAQTTTYSVTGTTNGCSSINSVTIQVQPLPNLLISTGSTTICQGQAIAMTVSGATSYLWSTGQTQASIQPNPTQTTTYSVTGTINGCSATTARTITVQSLPSLSINASALTICQGQSVSLTANGANSYLWSTGEARAGIQPAPTQATTYSVTGITNGCSSVTAVSVGVQALPALSINASALTICQGQSVSLTANGANSYLWSTGEARAGIQPAPTQATTYSVTGTTNGCSSITTVSVGVQALPSLSINAGALTICQGQSVSLTANGANSYLWSTGEARTGIQPAPTQATTYSVTGITNGCSSVTTVSVGVQALPSLSINAGALTICQGQSVSLTANGANSYLWSTGEARAGIQPAPTQATTYSVTGITNGCSSVTTVSVGVQALPSLSINASALTICQGQSVSLTANGANSYLWSTGEARAGIQPAPTQATTYSVTGITNGCSSVTTVSVGVQALPSLSINAGALTVCQGQSVSLTANGANSYLWSTGEARAGIQPAPTQATTYSVTGTTNGCSSITTVSVGVQALPSLSINASALTICQGQSVSLTASGANSYLWSTGEARAGIQPAPTQATTYSVTGTINGCSATAAVSVGVNALPSLSINASALTVCQGQSVSLTANGANSYLWSTGEVRAGIQPAPTQATTYSVTGIANGCSATAAVSVGVQALPSLSINASALTICQGQSVSLTANGANSYLWSTGEARAGIQPAPIQATTYSVTGTANGCSATATVSVGVQALPSLSINASALTICQGQSVSLTANGANSYLWSTGEARAGIQPAPTQATTYSVTGTTNGCSSITTVSVGVQALPALSINASTLTICQGQSVSLTANGANSYLWSTGEARAGIQPAPTQATTYSVTGITNGCSATAAVSVGVQACPLTLSAVVTNCQAGELSLQLIASGGNGSSYEYASLGITPWTTQAGPYTVAVFSDTAPFRLLVRNADNPTDVISYTLPIPACARPLPVTVTAPQTETASQPLQITGASINCDSRLITVSTTGGNQGPIYQRILLVTNFLPASQPLILDYDVFAERKPVQLQAQQGGVNSPLFTFDYSSQCQSVTTTQPVTQTVNIPQQSCGSPAATLGQPLALSTSLSCRSNGGVLAFFPTGGQNQANTVFEFLSPGITGGWTTSCTVIVTDADQTMLTFVRQRNLVTNEVLAQAVYTLTNPCASGAGRTSISEADFFVTVQENPTADRQAAVVISANAPQTLWLAVSDLQGRVLSQQQIESSAIPTLYHPELGSSAGVYLLTVRSIQKRRTFSIIRQ